MHWLLLNLPFMIFATALILGVLSFGMYLEYRKQDGIDTAKSADHSVVAKAPANEHEKAA